MGAEDAIEKIEVSNQKLKVDLEQLGD